MSCSSSRTEIGAKAATTGRITIVDTSKSATAFVEDREVWKVVEVVKDEEKRATTKKATMTTTKSTTMKAKTSTSTSTKKRYFTR